MPEADEREEEEYESVPTGQEKQPEQAEPELDEPADEEGEEFNPADYEDWSIEDLKAEIAEWGGEPKKRAKKSELINQLGKLMQADEELPFE